MSCRILFISALVVFCVGCVERYDFKHVSNDMAGVDAVDASGGDARVDARQRGDVCEPDCAGKICGPDGCDGSCGVCGDGYDCSAKGDACEEDCVALCVGLECGTAGLDDECDCGEGCDDEEDCTDDYCGGGICIYDPLDQECSDEDPCTVGDWCTEGACKGTDKDCDDGNPCTDDFCNEDGNCDYSSNTSSCDDADPCTVSDICFGGSCAGADKDCDDGNDCTLDSCGDSGVCDHDPVAMNTEPCDDGNPCTDDLCSGGACVGTPKPIEDLVALECICAEDADCAQFEDGDVCNGTLICDKHDDGDEEGICAEDAETIPACTDEIECTINACDPLSGCTVTPDHVFCDDGDGCTDDTCDGALGCLNENNTAECDDENACTENDVCAEGACAGPDAKDCDDQVDCTTDDCAPETGCTNVPDPEACPAGGECQLAVCHPTDGCLLEDADDDTPCTDGFCLAGECHVTGGDLDCSAIFDCVKECGPQDPDCATQCVDAGTDEAKSIFGDVIECIDAECGNPPDDPGCPLEAETGACATEVGICEGGCAQDCDGKDCGDDGCGGTCGDCEATEECQDGACVEAAGVASCSEVRACTLACEAGPGGADCRDACVATGDPDAQDLYDAILECVSTECGTPPTPGCIPTVEAGVCAPQVAACEADCDPDTCEGLGKDCGDWDDGCGDSINCGNPCE